MVLIFSLFGLNACGFSPLYAQNSTQPYMQSALASISVSYIPDRVGQIMRNELQQRLSPKSSNVAPVYTLSVSLTESMTSLAIDQTQFATRSNLHLISAYQLTRISDHASIISGTLETVASYNILSSDFANLAAQANARKLAIIDLARSLRSRIAVHFKINAPKPPTANAPSRRRSSNVNYGYPN